MGEIVVQAFITLDGVVQSCGAPDEDRDGGFERGGWALDYDARHDKLADVEKIVADWEKRTEALLLGRVTYEIWANTWGVWDENAPGLQGELTRRYNRVPKYVASRTLKDLGWRNSHLLGPNVAETARQLRAKVNGEIRVWGSTKLIKTLAENSLVDEYRLVIYPLVLGSGKKLFSDAFAATTLVLASSRMLRSGVLVNTYRRAEAV